MPNITLYTTPMCPYCIAAKTLLTGKNITYKEIDVSGNVALRTEMSQRAFGRT
ncbi:MAG: glutaredoxin domain-containing protein, partial [Hyphomicrobiales bacterium]